MDFHGVKSEKGEQGFNAEKVLGLKDSDDIMVLYHLNLSNPSLSLHPFFSLITHGTKPSLNTQDMVQHFTCTKSPSSARAVFLGQQSLFPWEQRHCSLIRTARKNPPTFRKRKKGFVRWVMSEKKGWRERLRFERFRWYHLHLSKSKLIQCHQYNVCYLNSVNMKAKAEKR